MMTFSVPMKDLTAYEAKLGKAMFRHVVKALRFTAVKVRGYYKARTQDAPPASANGRSGAIASGTYFKGWKIENVKSGAVVYNDAPHALYVELGRRPGKPPPVEAIIGWLRVKGIRDTSTKKATGQRRGKKGRFLRSNARGIAFLIARAIGRRGLRGRFVIRRSVEFVQRTAQADVLAGLDRAMKAAKG